LFNLDILEKAEKDLAQAFEEVDKVSRYNQYKVLQAFWDNNVSEAMLHGTTGYGYDDRGRDVLDRVYAQAFGCEDALVRHNFVSGTHVLATVFYALLRPNDTVFSVSSSMITAVLGAIFISDFNASVVLPFDPASNIFPTVISVSIVAADSK